MSLDEQPKHNSTDNLKIEQPMALITPSFQSSSLEGGTTKLELALGPSIHRKVNIVLNKHEPKMYSKKANSMIHKDSVQVQ